MRHPLRHLAFERLGAMHAGIVEHHDGESIRFFLDYKLVECFDDRLGGHRFGSGVGDQFPGSAEEPQYIQPSAM